MDPEHLSGLPPQASRRPTTQGRVQVPSVGVLGRQTPTQVSGSAEGSHAEPSGAPDRTVPWGRHRPEAGSQTPGEQSLSVAQTGMQTPPEDCGTQAMSSRPKHLVESLEPGAQRARHQAWGLAGSDETETQVEDGEQGDSDRLPRRYSVQSREHMPLAGPAPAKSVPWGRRQFQDRHSSL